jgi:hypothetical protein
MKLTPCKFCFDDGVPFDGYALGSTWNGFDNVAVTPEVLEQIKRYSASQGYAEAFEGLEPDENGLISFANGFSTVILDENAVELRAYEICAKWVSRIGGGFHPDTRGKDYTPEMSAEEISEYDRDMDELFRIAGDPYAFAIAAGGLTHDERR